METVSVNIWIPSLIMTVYKKTRVVHQVTTSGTMSDNEWQQMTTNGTTNGNEWEQVKKSDFRFPNEIPEGFYSFFYAMNNYCIIVHYYIAISNIN